MNRKYFKPLKTIKYGGSGYPMLEGIIGNINQKNRFSKFRIRFILWIERSLETIRIIEPLFIMSVGEKRKLMEEKWLADRRAHMKEMEQLKRKCLPMMQMPFYSINSKLLSHLVKPLQDVLVRPCADGLKITVKGPYPQLELPTIHVPPGAPFIIKVQVIASTDGYLKFYYRSKSSDDYIEEKTYKKTYTREITKYISTSAVKRFRGPCASTPQNMKWNIPSEGSITIHKILFIR